MKLKLCTLLHAIGRKALEYSCESNLCNLPVSDLAKSMCSLELEYNNGNKSCKKVVVE